ncbi:NAD(P)H-dependent oxidoreductase subunit E [Myxococcaceae bacterium GXIMD 01537]
MKRYRLSVCKGMDCKAGGADGLAAAAREELARRGLVPRCELYRGGCYGFCHMGPNVVVREDTGRKRDPLSGEDYQLMGWPGEVYYSRMSPEKMVRVIAEHIERDTPIPEYFGQPDE